MHRDLPKHIKWSVIDRWATNPFLVKTFADNIQKELNQFPENIRDDVIILFSAHSIPLKVNLHQFFFGFWFYFIFLLFYSLFFFDLDCHPIRLSIVEMHIHRRWAQPLHS